MIQCKDCGTKWGDEAIKVPTCPLCGSPLRDSKIDFNALTRDEVIVDGDEDPDAWMDKEPEPYVSDKPKKMKQSGRGLKSAYRDSILKK